MTSVAAVLAEVFGVSDEESTHIESYARQEAYRDIAGISGLHLVKQLVSGVHQAALMGAIEAEGWFSQAGTDQAMRFGNLPSWADRLMELVPKDLLPEKVRNRIPLFNQLAVNRYKPGEGLKEHVDLHPTFEDGICIFSFGSAAVMTFKPCTEGQYIKLQKSDRQMLWEESASVHGDSNSVDVLLEPGDMLALSGVARYQWTHGIRPNVADEWKGSTFKRGCRMSVTLRRLRPIDES